jgi:hypothetical protein
MALGGLTRSEALSLSGFRMLEPGGRSCSRISRSHRYRQSPFARNGTSQLIHTCYTRRPLGVILS